MTMKELENFASLFGDSSKKFEKTSLQGAWQKYANPNLIPLEEGAWERAVVEKYSTDSKD